MRNGGRVCFIRSHLLPPESDPSNAGRHFWDPSARRSENDSENRDEKPLRNLSIATRDNLIFFLAPLCFFICQFLSSTSWLQLDILYAPSRPLALCANSDRDAPSLYLTHNSHPRDVHS